MDIPADATEAGPIAPAMGPTQDAAAALVQRLSSAARRAQAARRAKEARVRFWRIIVVSAFFVVVLGANLFVGAVVVVGSIRDHADAKADPPGNMTARIKRPLLDGEFCRFTVFNNKLALTLEERVERCDAADRLMKSKGKNGFSWGG